MFCKPLRLSVLARMPAWRGRHASDVTICNSAHCETRRCLISVSGLLVFRRLRQCPPPPCQVCWFCAYLAHISSSCVSGQIIMRVDIAYIYLSCVSGGRCLVYVDMYHRYKFSSFCVAMVVKMLVFAVF